MSAAERTAGQQAEGQEHFGKRPAVPVQDDSDAQQHGSCCRSAACRLLRAPYDGGEKVYRVHVTFLCEGICEGVP